MIRFPGPLTANHKFEFKARGLRDTFHKKATFSKNYRHLKNPEDWVNPQPDLINQTKARGYSIWCASSSRIIYQDKFGAWAPHSLDAAEKILGRLLEALDGLQKRSTGSRNIQSTRCPDLNPEALKALEEHLQKYPNAYRTRLRRARGLVRPGAVGLLAGMEYSWVVSNSWVCPTSFISTRIGVELVDILGT